LAVVAQPLLDQGFLFGGEADLLGTSAGVADGQDPDQVAGSAGADGTAGAMPDAAMEQGAAQDLGGGRQGGGESGAGFGDGFCGRSNLHGAITGFCDRKQRDLGNGEGGYSRSMVQGFPLGHRMPR